MNDRYIKKMIEAGNFRSLAATLLPIPPDTPVLLDNVMNALKGVQADLRRITPPGLPPIVCAFRRNWTAIPFETGHPFHGKVDSRSEATHGLDGVYS